ncbi:MAG: alpha/beta hydrolase [Chloroflexaceae bacterium]|nr:alpha/beta hydrolase [Chloroflexaceae bacterium]
MAILRRLPSGKKQCWPLPTAYCAIAPDLRGYGLSDRMPVDATRGMRDFSADLHTLSGALGLERFHLVGHSLGGCVAMQYAIEHPQRVRSLTLVAAGSPYGFGGTKDTDGTPCWPDYAGSGGGLIHPEWLQRLKIGDRSDDSNFSPLRMLRERCSPDRWPHAEALNHRVSFPFPP